MPATSCFPYLSFDGNCREAFEFYRSVFGGEFHVLSTFGDGPDDMTPSEADKDRIMHVSLGIGSTVLMGSDTSHGDSVEHGDDFSLSVTMDDADDCDDLLARLSEGGTVTMPMEQQFWGAYFGMCTDRFGINWMVLSEPDS